MAMWGGDREGKGATQKLEKLEQWDWMGRAGHTRELGQ